jgi:hypothetical protein
MKMGRKASPPSSSSMRTTRKKSSTRTSRTKIICNLNRKLKYIRLMVYDDWWLWRRVLMIVFKVKLRHWLFWLFIPSFILLYMIYEWDQHKQSSIIHSILHTIILLLCWWCFIQPSFNLFPFPDCSHAHNSEIIKNLKCFFIFVCILSFEVYLLWGISGKSESRENAEE